MTSYVIAGAGPAGLYTAYRLFKSGELQPGDTVDLLEWSPARVGGRIHTYTFPSASGQYVETGGMRFSADLKFPKRIKSGHVLVQNLIVEMGLAGNVVPFFMSSLTSPATSSGRLYYLRGVNFYEDQVATGGVTLPYNFDAPFTAAGYDRMVAEDVRSCSRTGAATRSEQAITAGPRITTSARSCRGSARRVRSPACR